MPNRHISTETKVQVMEECLCLVNVEPVAARHGVSPGAIYYWFDQKIKPALGEVLVNERPGPKPHPTPVQPGGDRLYHCSRGASDGV